MTQPEHDPVERLERLTELHRKGALTDEEFEEQKSVLLRRMIEGGRAVEPDQVSQQGATKTGMDTSEDSGSSSGSPQAEPPPNRAETVVPETGPPDTSRPDDDGLRQGQVLSDTDSGLPRSLEAAHAGQTGAAEGRPDRGARSRWPWIAGGAGVLVLAAVITTVVLISGGSDEPAAQPEAAGEVTVSSATAGLDPLPKRLSLEDGEKRSGLAKGIVFWSPAGNVRCRAGYGMGAQRIGCTRKPQEDSVEVSGPRFVPPQTGIPEGEWLPAEARFSVDPYSSMEQLNRTDWVLRQGPSSTLDLSGIEFVCSAPNTKNIVCKLPAEGLEIRQGAAGPSPRG